MRRGEDREAVARDLLALLRERLGGPGLAYADPPAPLSGGFDTAVYALRLAAAEPPYDSPLVLRCFRDEGGAERARRETLVQNAVADLGYPCPRVLLQGDGARVDGACFTLMERVPGVAMVDVLLRPLPGSLRLPPRMGSLHARLHDLDPSPLVERMRAAGISHMTFDLDALLGMLRDLVSSVPERSADGEGLRAAIGWLEAARPARAPELAICHNDFHPVNIMLESDGMPSGVIDWSDALITDPLFDVARSVTIAGHAPVEAGAPMGWLVPIARRLLARGYLRGYRVHRPLDRAGLDFYLALNALHLYLKGRPGRAEGAQGQAEAWALPGVMESLARGFARMTGIALSPPPPPMGATT